MLLILDIGMSGNPLWSQTQFLNQPKLKELSNSLTMYKITEKLKESLKIVIYLDRNNP